jgi:hypothetical protein
MNTSTPNSVSTDLLSEHATVTPSILYFGTPVVLLSTENENGTFNLAPMSSAWALGHAIVLGLGAGGQTAHNLRSRHDLVSISQRHAPQVHQYRTAGTLADESAWRRDLPAPAVLRLDRPAPTPADGQ